jgi:hypothetical protein
MASPLPVPGGFPDDEGADDFVREFRQAVAPVERESLAHTPPLIVLDVGAEEAGYEARVRRVVEALEQSVWDPRGTGDAKAAPYARVAAGHDDELLSGTAARSLLFGLPKNMTPDRLPGFWPLWDSVDYIRRHADERHAPGANVLRDHAHEQLRLHRRQRREGHRQVFLWALGGGAAPPAGGLRGWLLGSVWHGLTRTFPRWCWERRKTALLVRSGRLAHRRYRGWLGRELGLSKGSESVFEVLDEAADRHLNRLVLPPDHEDYELHRESLLAFERLLTRALLEDLTRPPVGRLLPLRRRRTARPLLLVPLPRPDRPEARAAERFLRAFHEEQPHTAHRPGPLVVAVGHPSERLRADLHRPEPCDLRQASRRLQQVSSGPVLVRLRGESFARDGLVVRSCSPRRYRLGGRTVATAVTTGATLGAVLLGVGAYEFRAATPPSYACVGGAQSVAEDAREEKIPVAARAWYDAARNEIEKQNKRARQYATRGKRVVRTVVVFVSAPPADEDQTRFDGIIPELRGIALWQRQLNDDATANTTLVPLVVEVRETGETFRDAVPEATKLADQVRAQSGAKDQDPVDRVVGVLGYAQSRPQTRDALAVLDRAGIPVVGTTATADEMQNGAGTNYWPFTPNNSTEARIEAEFARKENIVARDGSATQCVPAGHAVVVRTSTDLYSRSLSAKFAAAFPGTELQFDFSQEGKFAANSPGQRITSAGLLAQQICAALKAQPDSVVYWSARAQNFVAFVNAMERDGACTDRTVTVLGGNELTNVAQTGIFANKDWLRLYYTDHRMPSGDKRASAPTKRFAAVYDDFVEKTTKGTDPWRQDGHAAVSYDAFHALSEAVAGAFRADASVPLSSVRQQLQQGITFDGATGHIAYRNFNAPPADKTLVLLRQVADTPKAVVACGAYNSGPAYRYEKQGVPCEAGAG